MPTDSFDQRAADADRERAASALAHHLADGRITVDEHARRTDAAYRARTLGELAAVSRDLPAIAPPARRALLQHAPWRAHVALFLVVTVVGVGLWTVTTDLTPRPEDDGAGYYWPLWAALVWALVVAVHGLHAIGLLARRASPPGPTRAAGVATACLAELTDRERDVMRQLAHGRSNKQIAAALGISERTARTHVSNILLKLGLTSRTEAALLAARADATEGTNGVAPTAREADAR
jgi:DNA-binding CsgD family transcriptional regulator